MSDTTHETAGRARPPTLAGLYDAHAGWMHRHAVVLLADRAAAEDAVQQVFVKLAAMGPRLPELAAEGGYLRRALRNECYRLLSRSRLSSGPFLEPAAPENRNNEEHEALEAALKKLPPEQREVIHLKVYEGLTFERVGEAMGIPANTAASRYRYAVEKLREMLKD